MASRDDQSQDGGRDSSHQTRKRKIVSDSLGRIAHKRKQCDAHTNNNSSSTSLVNNVDSNDSNQSTTIIPVSSGRGSVVGWTTCPLCGRHSKKRYALGRGIASHLHAVHTPWNPGKMERTKQRREYERHMALQRKKQKRNEIENATIANENESNGFNTTTISNDDDENNAIHDFNGIITPKPFEPWEPSQEERDSWDHYILNIVTDLEKVASEVMVFDGNTSCKNKNGSSHDHVEMIQSGLDRNGTKSRPYRDSLPLFLHAAANGDLQSLQGMVHSAITMSSSSDNKDSVTDNAVKELLATHDRHLSTAEHWAAGGGHLECLKYIFEMHEKYNNGAHSETPTTNDALISASNECVKKHVRRRDGKTCLHYAARNGQLECIKYLIHEKQFHVDETSGDGTTPLHLACFGGHYESIIYLVEKGNADIDKCNDWGCTVAHWVAMTRNQCKDTVWKICQYLHNDKKVSFAKGQKQGHSPLHKAAQRRNRPVIEWMMSTADVGGASLSIEQMKEAGLPDEGGHTPSEIWLSSGGDKDLYLRMKNEFAW